MPQTKFVLKKALELDLHVIVCINKIDRPEARPDEVIDEVLELLMDLDASDEQLDCPFLYASAKAGHAVLDLNDTPENMEPLFETILKYIPAPEGDPEAGTQVLISTIDYNEYVGRIGVGKVDNGKIAVNQEVMLMNHHDPSKKKKVKISKLYEFEGLNKVEVQEAGIGSIVAISGIPEIHIGDTLCDVENPEPIPFQKISEPTIAMHFMVNDSPLAGQPEDLQFSPKHLASLIELAEAGSVNNQVAKEVFEQIFAEDVDPEAYVEEHGLKTVNDTGLLEETARKVLENNPGPVEQYKSGKTKVLGFLVGQVMKEMKGKANPAAAGELLQKLLSE